VLNAELPQNSRASIIQSFNRGVFRCVRIQSTARAWLLREGGRGALRSVGACTVADPGAVADERAGMPCPSAAT